MTNYLEALQARMSQDDHEKLIAIRDPEVHRIIYEAAELCNPNVVFICSDTPDELTYIKNQAIVNREESAALTLPGHTFHFDGPYDQGRVREQTRFLVPEGETLSKVQNQIERGRGLTEVKGFLKNSMRGRTMICRFLNLGPVGSVFSIPCLECTDSWYVAHSVDLLYRHGYETFFNMTPGTVFFKTIHAMGNLNERMESKDHEKKRIYIDYLDNLVYSVNTQYAGNSIGFKKLALRLAIRLANQEGWLAEHFMIMGVNGPNSRKTYLAGAFPSGCGKTSTAMLPGETILADDIAYVRNIDGHCRAVNVESGIFGIIQDVNARDDPIIHAVLTNPGEIIFSNVLVKDGRPWWLGMDVELPETGVNYSGIWFKGKTDDRGKKIQPAHKNARYTLALEYLDNCDAELNNPEGVELGGVIYGGRDSQTYVPVQQGFSWEHGIISYGAALETEVTFAVMEAEGKHEINMMSIQDFISVSFGRYLQNYIEFGQNLEKEPLVFGVNYFLRNQDTGDYLNERQDKHVWIKWMALRVNGEADAIETPTGWIPVYEDLRLLFAQVRNKDYSREDYIAQFTTRVPENLAKIERVEKYYSDNIDDMPDHMWRVLQEQHRRLVDAQKKYGDYISPDVFEKVP